MEAHARRPKFWIRDVRDLPSILTGPRRGSDKRQLAGTLKPCIADRALPVAERAAPHIVPCICAFQLYDTDMRRT